MLDRSKAGDDVSGRLTRWRNLQVGDEFRSAFVQLLKHIDQNEGELSIEEQALHEHLSRRASPASSGRDAGRATQASDGAITHESLRGKGKSPESTSSPSRDDRGAATNVNKTPVPGLRELMRSMIHNDEHVKVLDPLFKLVRDRRELGLSLDLICMMRCLTSSEFTMDDTVRADLAFAGSKTLYALVYQIIDNAKMQEWKQRESINIFSRAYCGILNNSDVFRRQCQCRHIEYGSPVDEQLVEPVTSVRSPGTGSDITDKVRPLSCYVYREPNSRLYRKAEVELL